MKRCFKAFLLIAVLLILCSPIYAESPKITLNGGLKGVANVAIGYGKDRTDVGENPYSSLFMAASADTLLEWDRFLLDIEASYLMYPVSSEKNAETFFTHLHGVGLRVGTGWSSKNDFVNLITVGSNFKFGGEKYGGIQITPHIGYASRLNIPITESFKATVNMGIGVIPGVFAEKDSGEFGYVQAFGLNFDIGYMFSWSF